ncbi:PrpF protein [Crepidotus variabilis]|uniref:PrpF protein n=1 Tax=Crepidotus variabilis TaxID=179855 RepID=A0A9P6E9F5_9AGAR|nr:PrpF protein [Crepidotus variabilis]
MATIWQRNRGEHLYRNASVFVQGSCSRALHVSRRLLRPLTLLHSYSMRAEASNPISASFLRGGTSKGIFLQEKDLPSDRSQWDKIFIGIMGSPDPDHGRQLNGMGGGISSLSKICVVGRPTALQQNQGIDVNYTFVQVGIKDSSIDVSGNCGNLSSMIGVYALDEGICSPRRSVPNGRVTIRSFNANTSKIIDTTFPITEDGVATLDLSEVTTAGVAGLASKIVLEFVEPAGARTGKLLPTGQPEDTLEISWDSSSKYIPVSLVDATNPTVFLSFDTLNDELGLNMNEYLRDSQPSTRHVSEVLEQIRRAGAIKMGLDPSAQAQPKIAFVNKPLTPNDEEHNIDIVVHALSMGVLHKAVPMTVGLCLGVASKIQGTIPWKIAKNTLSHSSEYVRIRHPSGIVDVGPQLDGEEVRSVSVLRTGRRLMKGVVWW